MIAQAIILAAGNGKRLGKLGEHYPKIALPIGNKPLYQLHIEMLISLGINDLIFVVSPASSGLQREIRQYGQALTRPVSIQFVIQAEPKGIAHALLQCAGYVQKYFVVLMGDTFFQLRAPFWRTPLQNKLLNGYAAVLSVREEKNEDVIKRECTVKVDAQGDVQELIEKPEQVLSTLKPCGLYFFSRAIFQYIEQTSPSPLRGEIELTDAIALAAKKAGTVSTADTVAHDINITYIQNYHEANLYYLQQSGVPNIIDRTVRLGKGVEILDSIIGNAVILGDKTCLKRCVVLPGSRVLERAKLNNTVVFNSAIIL